MITNQSQLYDHYEFQKVIDKRNKEAGLWKWIVLLGCFLIQMIPYCVAVNLTNVFSSSDWKEWVEGNTTLIGLTFTVSSVISAILGPFIAMLFNKKVNLRLLFSVGVALSMFGIMGCSINSIVPITTGKLLPVPAATVILWTFNTFRQLGFLIFSTYGVNNLISKWWPAEKRGVVLGIAFAGGSLGNIWMQQVMQILANTFGNTIEDYNAFNGHQYATYLIVGTFGLVGGLLAILIACKKPVPPLDILNASADTNNVQVNVSESNGVSPLVTQKYPPYWILCVGLFFLQMGAIHSQFNSIYIGSALEAIYPTFGGGAQSVLALCGTLLGVSCLVGNTFGGFLNDKLGPYKSVLFAGMLQICAITCLMYSINQPELIYVYYCLIGMSVYLFTSTNAFICGRLFGTDQATSHLAIIGMFTAIGFAIASPTAGAIIGDTSQASVSTLFGKSVHGNWQPFFIFLYIAMTIGILLISTSCFIISSRGIKGLKLYSPTKYSKVIWLKHHVAVNFLSNWILLKGKDYRIDNEKRNNKIDGKKEKDKYYWCFKEYKELIESSLKQQKLSKEEINILSLVLFLNKANKSRINEFLKTNDIDKYLDSLVKKDLIKLNKISNFLSFYSISDSLAKSLESNINELNHKHPNISKQIKSMDNLIQKENDKLNKKVNKINQKIEQTNQQQIDENKKQQSIQTILNKVDSLTLARKTKMDKIDQNQNFDEWKKFKIDYELSSRIIHEQEKELNIEKAKENKLNQLNKKIATANFINNYNINHIIDGNYLLINYYNDTYKTFDSLINDKIDLKLHNQQVMINTKKSQIDYKLNKVVNKRNKFNNN